MQQKKEITWIEVAQVIDGIIEDLKKLIDKYPRYGELYRQKMALMMYYRQHALAEQRKLETQ
ncbi:MAG: hypothetical protein AUG51_20875 [Acidobacteria bacterium 13_1_20CM_3_53_8]|nr:MAG: hypothetical protein AUH05_06560 [Ktedonobacter sp. 13_2_20CM_53_11]OLE51877.1 MAG: hypothetical protein AUG51_20875 [Acidobacteria bacterium 13_1_20CM_3_53_8]